MRRTTTFHLLALVLLVAAGFGNTLGNGFVWDDNLYVVTNKAYRSADLRAIFTTLGNGVEYLPVRDLSHVVDFLLWGDRAAGFHLTNVAVYAAGVLALYFFCRGLYPLLAPAASGKRVALAAFAASLLFALHPIHSQAVAWVTGRNALLAALFFFLAAASFLAGLRREGRRRHLFHAAAFAFFLLALFAKATAVMFPFVLLLAIVLGRRGSRLKESLTVLPFLLASIGVFFLFSEIGERSGIIPARDACSGLRCLMEKGAIAVQIPFFYLGKLLLPLGLAADYGTPFSRDPASLRVLLCAAALLVVTAGALLVRRKWPGISFAVGWYLVTLVPVLDLLGTFPVVADRYAFFPSLALPLLIASPLLTVSKRHLPVLLTFVGGLALFWGVLAVNANAVWKSEESLWSHAGAVEPRSGFAHYQLGRIYYRTGRLDAAMAQFATAQALDPRHPYHDFFRGYLCFLSGDYGCAFPLFEAAVAVNPDFIDPLYHLGVILDKLGRPNEAQAYYRRVLTAREQDMGGFRVLARERLGMGR